jgi:histidyl-tRNA synthetase
MGKEPIGIPRGTRDFGPGQMLLRNRVFSVVRGTFERFGFAPLETPAMENLSVLTGKYGDEGEQLIYKVLNSGDFLSQVKPEDVAGGFKNLTRKISEKALRYDLTVPLARYVVMNRNVLTFPFRRYQMQPVWRADRPSFGRYREFYQCDADIVGTSSLICEVEIMQMICSVLRQLEVSDFIIKINHRKILSGLAEFCGAPGREAEMSVSLDKLDKVEWTVVAEELAKKQFDGAFIETLASLRSEPLSVDSDAYQALVDRLSSNPAAASGFSDLNQIFSFLAGFPEVLSRIQFDLSLARGLSYYTGPIFEVVPRGVRVGSISGGGRYDELTSVFGVDGIPGVGFSFGIDRICDLLQELGKTGDGAETPSQLLMVQFESESIPYYLQTLNLLREAGICCELYPEAVKMKKQFSYADAKKIAYVLLAGEDEIKQEKYTLKHLGSGQQQLVSFQELLDILQNNRGLAL